MFYEVTEGFLRITRSGVLCPAAFAQHPDGGMGAFMDYYPSTKPFGVEVDCASGRVYAAQTCSIGGIEKVIPSVPIPCHTPAHGVTARIYLEGHMPELLKA